MRTLATFEDIILMTTRIFAKKFSILHRWANSETLLAGHDQSTWLMTQRTTKQHTDINLVSGYQYAGISQSHFFAAVIGHEHQGTTLLLNFVVAVHYSPFDWIRSILTRKVWTQSIFTRQVCLRICRLVTSTLKRGKLRRENSSGVM